MFLNFSSSEIHIAVHDTRSIWDLVHYFTLEIRGLLNCPTEYMRTEGIDMTPS